MLIAIETALRRFDRQEYKQQTAWLILVAFTFFVLSEPLNLLHGHLFAEEGTDYLRYARLVEPLRALTAPHQQYFALFPNALALLVARVLPLSWAAVFSAWSVLLVHVWVIYVVAQCELFTQAATRVVAVATVLLAPGAAPLVVGSTQTQFLFAFACVVVLISNTTSHRFSRTLAVAMGGLNGVGSCILTPFYLYRAFRTQDRLAAIQAGILCFCSVIQGLVLLHAMPFASRGGISHRSMMSYINAVSNHMLVLPFLTRFFYHAATFLGRAPLFASILFTLAGVTAFLGLARILWPGGTVVRTLLLVGVFHGFCCVMGIEGKGPELLGSGERYFFVANGAIVLALVLRWQQLRTASPQSAGGPVSLLLSLLLVSGCVDSVRFWKLNQANNGAVWADQVRTWRRDPAHTMLKPNPAGWAGMYLPPKPMNLRLPFYILIATLG